MPKRIQRKRTKGWKMPDGAVYVGRPSKWGNPWKVGDWYAVSIAKRLRLTPPAVVKLYREYLATAVGTSGFSLAEQARVELAGRDLACWCPLDQPCHADVLLDVANRQETP